LVQIHTMNYLTIAILVTFQILFIKADFAQIKFAGKTCDTGKYATIFNKANTNDTCVKNIQISCNETHMATTTWRDQGCGGPSSTEVVPLGVCFVRFATTSIMYCGKNMPTKTKYNHASELSYDTQEDCTNNRALLYETVRETGKIQLSMLTFKGFVIQLVVDPLKQHVRMQLPPPFPIMDQIV
jgi:hypothetical protein